jgi:hypothetical protein
MGNEGLYSFYAEAISLLLCRRPLGNLYGGPVGCIQIFYTGFRVIPADKIFSALKITHNLSARILTRPSANP